MLSIYNKNKYIFQSKIILIMTKWYVYQIQVFLKENAVLINEQLVCVILINAHVPFGIAQRHSGSISCEHSSLITKKTYMKYKKIEKEKKTSYRLQARLLRIAKREMGPTCPTRVVISSVMSSGPRDEEIERDFTPEGNTRSLKKSLSRIGSVPTNVLW